MSATEIRILVVDGDADIARGTARLLEKAGYATAIALTGEETLRALPFKRPDLVLLDRDLKDQDGAEICRQIKSNPAYAHVHVILTSSAYTTIAEQVEGLELGADGYIVRPIGNRELFARVEAFARLLRRHRAQIAIELRYRGMFESVLDGILILEAETGRIVDVNPFLVELLGLSRENVLGKAIWELGIFKDIVANQVNFAELQKKEYIRYEDMPIETSDGRHIDVEFVSNVYLVDQRKVIQCNIRDISERKKAADVSHAISAHQEVILATVQDIIMEVDNRKVYTWANSAGFEFFGDDVIGKEVAAFFEGEQDTYAKVKKLFDGDQQVIYLESWQRRKDGEKRLLAWWCHVLKDKQGHATGALSTARDITESKWAEAAVVRERVLSDAIIDSIPGTFYMLDKVGQYVRWNAYQRDEIIGKPDEVIAGMNAMDTIHPDDRIVIQSRIANVLETGAVELVEGRVLLRGGPEFRWLLMTGRRMMIDGNPFLVGIGIDITGRKQAEVDREQLQAQFIQAQKMESVGRLAGGVAHDFNNLLMGIMGYTQLCLDTVGPEHPIREWLDELKQDAERSARLTQQLLAFARKQVIAPKVLDINEAIEGMLKLLRRLIGEDISIKWAGSPDTWRVKLDPIQIDQILANLAVNARDAIKGVGSMVIETGNVTLDQAYCAGHPGAVPGNYVLLTVSDSGCGMDRETLGHIFEPFFTTKELGQGTGLGLATVYGIVKQNDGFISVCSELGKGTTFKIYLPQFGTSETAPVAVAIPGKPPRGTETILLVEDEKSVRVTTGMFLEDLGYTLLVAEASAQALRLVAEHPGEIHLLITDVIMPGMSGRDLADRLAGLRPAIKRLYISGFTADVIAQRGILADGVHFLSKPFGRDALARKVREVLEVEGQGEKK